MATKAQLQKALRAVLQQGDGTSVEQKQVFDYIWDLWTEEVNMDEGWNSDEYEFYLDDVRGQVLDMTYYGASRSVLNSLVALCLGEIDRAQYEEELAALEGRKGNDGDDNNAAHAWLMNRVLETMNNEEAYYGSWLYTWPDGTNYEDCEALFSDQESFDDLEAAYLDAFTEYYEDGWYKLNAQADKRDIVNMIADTLRKLNIAGALQEVGKDLHEVVSKAGDARKYDVRGILREALRTLGYKFRELENDKKYERLRGYVEQKYGEDAFEELYMYLETYIDSHGSYGLDDAKVTGKVGDARFNHFFVIYELYSGGDQIETFEEFEEETMAIDEAKRLFEELKNKKDPGEIIGYQVVEILLDSEHHDVSSGVLWQKHLEEALLEDGVAADMTVEDIAKKHGTEVEKIEKQLEIGIEIEMEHTDDRRFAEVIALDHLSEFPDYYDRLTKMEEEAADEKSKVDKSKGTKALEEKFQYVKDHSRRSEGYVSYIANNVKINNIGLTESQSRVAYTLFEDELYGYSVRNDEGKLVYDLINDIIEATEAHNSDLRMGFAGRQLGWLVLESWSSSWDEPYEYDSFEEAATELDFRSDDLEHDYKLIKKFDEVTELIISEYKKFLDEVADQIPLTKMEEEATDEKSKVDEIGGTFSADGEIVMVTSDTIQGLLGVLEMQVNDYPSDIYSGAGIDSSEFLEELNNSKRFQSFLDDPDEDYYEFDKPIKVVWQALDNDADEDLLFVSFQKSKS